MFAVGGLFKKNVAVTGFPFYLSHKATDEPVTSGSVVIYITQDGGTQTTVAGDGSAAHEGNGQWTVNLTQAEMNADVIGLLFTHPDAKTQHIAIVTDSSVAAILTDTNEMQQDWADGGRLDNILDAKSSQTTQDTIDTNVDTIVAKLPSKAYLSGSGDADGGVDSTEANVVADAMLKRDWTSVSGSPPARSMWSALRKLRNKWSISGTTLTVTEEDDSTAAWEETLTTDPSADPITASDPTT